MKTSYKIAVLIDAENTQHYLLGSVLSELSKFGHIVVKRAYGDWSSLQLSNWKKPLNELAIIPIQQFSYTYGKNASDAAMIIDAMDLLYSNKFDAFALITSDSDFTKLASRLKESQIFVIGVGEQKTPLSFRNACDNFISTEVLQKKENEPIPTPEEKTAEACGALQRTKKQLCCDTHLISLLRNAIREYEDEDGWSLLGSCGGLIKRQHPDFDPRTYGFPTLSSLIEATELFKIEKRDPGNGKSNIVYVKDERV
ncbi:NYN domain-containing protein [Desulfofustis glycolicus]|uniref:TIGR00288 family protein n=1 Tax=Desulfofustis glycolicus DSM 9705 TaxID=1121409 RepID=A0A1M5YLR2_9BACT|nr:NYN domain-containing protein [Desulfofustis glycolicus]SHI13015.1 TIGR00288 family protein [Desulfofustis glycolicus DSM 9705]